MIGQVMIGQVMIGQVMIGQVNFGFFISLAPTLRCTRG